MEKKIITTRVYQAPLNMVWAAWTDAELVKQWWGPDKFTCPEATIDFREGGVAKVAMKAPKEFGGSQWWNIWEYRNIKHLERIEFAQRFSDPHGRSIRPQEAGMPPDFPDVIITIVTFKDRGDGSTEITVVQQADLGKMESNAKMGMQQSLDKIAKLFPK